MICRVAQCMTAKPVSFDEGRRAGRRTTAGQAGGGGGGGGERG